MTEHDDEQHARAAAEAWEEARVSALRAERRKMIRTVTVWGLVAIVAVAVLIWTWPW